LAASSGFAQEPPFVATAPPKSPAEERASFTLPPGFEAQLVAAEPDIQKPINMAFDSRGRLWVTCTIEYPYPAKDRPGRDSIKILDDFGPDGRARKITTFADGLNIPIGILPDIDGNGCIVWSIPNIWHLRDTKGTGKADQRDVLFTGFGYKDTHGMISSLVRGFDGWVYACHGYANDSNVTAKDGSRIALNSGNTFRFKPDGSHIEIMCRGQVNPFGQCLDPLGNLYTACCHSKPITQLMRGAVFTSFSKPHDGLGFGPDMVHEYRGSTALCGLVWYDADHFPKNYRGRMFLGDVVFSCINIFDIERRGATYTAKQRKDDFLKSSDPWFRPVNIMLGPDGALYVADFYNRIIGHYEVPLTHPGRDRTSGRIWRIVATDHNPKTPRGNWTTATAKELIADLDHPNFTVRMLAMHQLVERGQEAVPLLRDEIRDPKGDTVRAQYHALWALERMGALPNSALTRVASTFDAGTRIQVMRILAERAALTPEQLDLTYRYLDGPSDGHVRRSAAEVLGRHPSIASLTALRAARGVPGNVADPFLLHAIRIALRDNLAALDDSSILSDYNHGYLVDAALGVPKESAAKRIASAMGNIAKEERDRLPEYLHHIARYGSPEMTLGLFKTIDEYTGADSVRTASAMLAMARGLQERGSALDPTLADWAGSACRRMLDSTDTARAQVGVDLIVTLRYRPLFGDLAIVGVDRQRPDAVRVAALTALAGLDGPHNIGTLAARVSDASESPALREQVAQALAGIKSPAARDVLLVALSTAPARLANAIAASLGATREGADALLRAIAAGKASPRLLVERSVRVKLDALKDKGIADQIAKLTEGLPPPDAAIANLLHKRADGYVKTGGDVAAGAKIFTQHCAACHQIAGQGTKIGPQLDGIGARGLERLLEDTLDPNRNVDPAFRTTTLNLKSGVTVNGLVLREEGEIVVLADNQGKEQRYEKTRIDTREVSPLSPMPANWAEQIPEKDFNNLMAYLLAQRGGK
jgi:putative heme-binding domain-containing protein